MRRRLASAVGGVVPLLLASLAATVPPSPSAPAPGGRGHPHSESQARQAYGQVPLAFEANVGQADPRVRFLAHSDVGTLFLTPTESVLATPDAALRLRLDGAATDPHLSGVGRQAAQINYLRGRDPAQWRLGVPSYAAVREGNVYPGVDMLWHGTQAAPEYDLVVAPGADPGTIRLVADGAANARLDDDGSLVLSVGNRQVRQRRPDVYQKLGGRRQPVAGSYVLLPGARVGFALGQYDRGRELVIDPLVYSTYLGGTGGRDGGKAIAADASGNAYVVGGAGTTNFPTTAGAFRTTNAGAPEVFVSKLNPSGSALVYSTFLGGGAADNPGAIAVDGAGNAFVAGATFSTDFPVTPGAFRTTIAGGQDGFVTKLNPTGSGLLYSTYLGGGADDVVNGMTIDSGGNAFAVGRTRSANFPTTPGALRTSGPAGPEDGFVTRLNASGSALGYSTYVGGGGFDELQGVAVDSSGDAYMTGQTTSTDFPTTAGAFRTTNPGAPGVQAAVEAKLNPAGSAFVYSTYLGGNAQTVGQAIAVDSAGNAYVAGVSAAADLPTTPGAFRTTRPSPSCCSTGFVTKLNPTGSGLLYSTWLGGSAGTDQPNAVVVDGSGNAYVAGNAHSTDFPTVNPVQGTFGGGFWDGYVSELNPAGSGLVFSTYLGGGIGGQGDDDARGIALDASSNIYITGSTESIDFPIAGSPFQATKQRDDTVGYVGKIGSGAGGVTGGAFRPLPPTRILDTRSGPGPVGALGPGATLDLQITGAGGIPASGVSAVVFNVTAVGSTAPGYLTVYPTGAGRPTSANLNYGTGEVVPNLVEVAVGAGGKVSLYNGSSGSTHYVVDVAGWVTTSDAAGGPDGRYNPLTPARILDTRPPPQQVNSTGTPLHSSPDLSLQVTGTGPVPATGVAAVVLNVAVTNTNGAGWITVYPTGGAAPLAANVNFVAGQTVSNRVVVAVGTGGKVNFHLGGAATSADVVADVGGWFTDATSTAGGSLFNGLTPNRITDTRPGSQVGPKGTPLGPGQTMTVTAAGTPGVPAMGGPGAPKAVVLNVAVTNTTASSYLTVFPSDAAQPLAADLNWAPGATRSNLVVAKVGTDGAVKVYNNAGNTDIVVDVLGWYA